MEMRFKPGHWLFQQGDPANRFYLILEGKVMIGSEVKELGMVPIRTLGPGDDLAWAWLFPPYRMHFSACAIEPTRAIFFYGSRLREKLSQEAGLVPIVEPELSMNGSHTIGRCKEFTNAALESVFAALFECRAVLELMLLKTGMILSGTECPQQAEVEEVTEATLRCFHRSVPAAVPGIVFLSGGQSDEVTSQRLNAICKAVDVPWRLSFSFGRALQSPALKIRKGSPANVEAAQAALHHRAKCNGLALQGKYSTQMENRKISV